MRRLLPKAFAFVLGAIILVSKTSLAQVPVALPTESFSERNVTIPVSIGDVTGEEVKAFLLTITYDATVIEVSDVVTDGDLAEDFVLVANSDVPGRITISGAHFEAISGEGTLLRLNGRFLKKGTTDLVFNSFAFNEGQPAAEPNNGLISNAINISNEDESLVPTSFELAGNYPNPFNPTTSIQFDLPETAEVKIDIVDMLGRVVMTIPSQVYQAGSSHRVHVDASSLASGIYVYQVSAVGAQKTYVETSTMTLIK